MVACSASSIAARAAATAASFCFGRRHQRERLLGLLDRAGGDVAAREAGERRDVLRLLLQQRRIDFRCGRGIAFGQRRFGGGEHFLLFAADPSP